MMEWEFEEVGANDLEQQPHRREFFRDTPRPEAFVREVLQNSLDAKSEDSDKVQVRFAFDEIPFKDIEDYIDGLEPHLKEWDVIPGDWEVCDNPDLPVLVIEDFGTIGLTGPVSRDKESTPEDDHFLNFWLREGMSGKSGTKGGRWGLGKNTFFMTTRINTFWGITKRNDDKEYLMGKAALKPHTIGDKRYRYFGFFRNENSKPIIDKHTLRHFKKTLPIKRKKHPGLSLVIPYPVSEINYESVLKSVIMHYFYPILRENLSIKVEDNCQGKQSLLKRKGLIKAAARRDWSDTNWEDKDVDELMNFVFNGIKNLESDSVFQLPDVMGEEKEINENLIGDELENIKEKFTEGNIVTLSIPVCIEPRNGGEKWGDFFVFLKQYHPSELSRSDEYYIRSGIRLPEESKLYNRLGKRPIRGMLIVEDNVVSSFLADAEVPAHTRWNEQTKGFSNKYDESQSTIRYIRNSMRDITSILIKTKEDRYEGLLQEYFSVVGGEGYTPQTPTGGRINNAPEKENDDEDEEDKNDKERTPDVKQSSDPGPDDEIPSKSRMLSITRVSGGFRIRFTSEEEYLPIEETLKAAYDVHRGNPFNQYEVFDFDFQDLNISGSGYEIEKREENELEFRVYDPNFEMRVVGFDESRDLIVEI